MDVTPTIRAATDTPSRDFYLAYLNSPAWRATRNSALKRVGYRCERCPAKRNLQVHHRNYDRLGGELPSDLEVLCENCHRDEHLEHPDQTSLGVYLKLASEAVRADPFGSITDLSDVVKTACAKRKIVSDHERIASALAVVCGNRQKTAPREQPTEAPEQHDQPLTRDESREILCRLGLIAAARQMPHAAPTNHRAVERLKASQFVAQEIIESIARCEALEREVEP